MNDEIIALLLLTALLLGAGIFFSWERHRMCIAFIEGDLLRQHATNIHATFDWLDWDRDTFTYDVRWMDAAGKWWSGRCKVRSQEVGPFGDDAVYWVTGGPPPNLSSHVLTPRMSG